MRKQVLRQAFVEGHLAVCGIERNPYEKPPATTMVAAVLLADLAELHLANAGDSISLIARGNEIYGIAEWQAGVLGLRFSIPGLLRAVRGDAGGDVPSNGERNGTYWRHPDKLPLRQIPRTG